MQLARGVVPQELAIVTIDEFQAVTHATQDRIAFRHGFPDRGTHRRGAENSPCDLSIGRARLPPVDRLQHLAQDTTACGCKARIVTVPAMVQR